MPDNSVINSFDRRAACAATRLLVEEFGRRWKIPFAHGRLRSTFEDAHRPAQNQIKMRACIQRVTEARVIVDDSTVAEIGFGLMVLVGVESDDTDRDADHLADRITGLRIFNDDQGKMNRSLLDVQGELLVVSQFTLCGDTRKGRRPSFIQAAPPEKGDALYRRVAEFAKGQGVKVQTGEFGANMDVHLCNRGPVTILLDSRKRS